MSVVVVLKDPGRLWPKLRFKPRTTFNWFRDLVWSDFNGGSMVREVAPGVRPLERHEFDVRDVRYDWSSRG